MIWLFLDLFSGQYTDWRSLYLESTHHFAATCHALCTSLLMSLLLLDMEKKKAILIKQHPSSRSWGKGFVHFDSEP